MLSRVARRCSSLPVAPLKSARVARPLVSAQKRFFATPIPGLPATFRIPGQSSIGGEQRRQGDTYVITKEERDRYHRDGYIVFDGVVSEEELVEIEEVIDKFIRGFMDVPGKDFCDMSKGLDAKPEDFSIINAMLPRKYYPPLAGNIFERRCASITRQLFGDGMVLDFDQILAKRPTKTDAVFAWHQDIAYWPRTKDERTATISLALDDATPANGCIKFVAGSHREKNLRRHYPMAIKSSKPKAAVKPGEKVRDEVHTLVTDVDETKEPVKFAPVKRGGASVHDERIVHGSGGNKTDGWRRTYIVVHRAYDTVKWERERNFTHSHNDSFNWDQYHDWAKNKPSA